MKVNITPPSLSPLHNSRIMTDLRQRKVINAVLSGKSRLQAGIEAGYSPRSADTQASMLLSKPETIETYRQILSRKGLSDEFLAEKSYDLINATQTLFFQKDGHIVSTRKVKALETQRKTLEMVTKVAGHLKDKTEVDIRVGIMAVVVDALQSSDDG